LQVYFAGVLIAETRSALRVLETSQPPAYYFPPADVQTAYLERAEERTWCEWKGRAGYYHLCAGDQYSPNAAWYYPQPTPAFAALKNYIAFYASRVDRCLVDGEAVKPQAGDFYGGWITSDVVVPFKGGPGTTGW
jgi:uncharacterized protein (DUF427 family)